VTSLLIIFKLPPNTELFVGRLYVNDGSPEVKRERSILNDEVVAVVKAFAVGLVDGVIVSNY
jgi:hypothetical protein